VAQLRLAFQKITGQDLNWFFNEWYLSAGHPQLDITYHYNDTTRNEEVTIAQNQPVSSTVPVFRIPMAVDVYNGNNKVRKQITVTQKNQTFTFACDQPDLVNVDAEGVLVCEKNDHKTDAQWAFQLRHAPNYRDRWEAVNYFNKDSASQYAVASLLYAMNDPQWQIRQRAVNSVHWSTIAHKDSLIQKLNQLASSDARSLVRADAIEQLGSNHDAKLAAICTNAINSDSSYAVLASALETLSNVDSAAALQLASKFQTEKNSSIVGAVAAIYAEYPRPEFENYFVQHFYKNDPSASQVILQYSNYLNNSVKRNHNVESGISALKKIATDSSIRFFSRYAATRSLTNLQKTMEAQASQMQNKLDTLPVGTLEYSELKNKLSQVTQNIYTIKDDVAFIKQHETDRRLKAIYNSQNN
jgi:aminopeptidase N